MAMEIIISVIFLIGGITILVIIHVCVVGRAFRDDHNPMNGIDLIPGRAGRISRMNEEDIEGLPMCEYNGDGIGNMECAVCLESFKEGEKCRILPKCDHIFHVECIDSWLLKNGACPICRTCAAKSQEVEQNSTSYSGDHEGGVVELE